MNAKVVTETNKHLHDFDSGFDMDKSLEKMRNDPSPDRRLRFFRELKAAQFLVPCRQQNHIAMLSTPAKENFLPAFTTGQELAKWPYPREIIDVMPFDKLKHMVINDPVILAGIAINPFGRAMLLRHPQLTEIDANTEGMTLRRTVYESNLRLEPTTDYPVDLPNALEALFRIRQNVYCAWLVISWGETGAAPHKLFIIDFGGDKKELFPFVAKAVQPFMKAGESFELMQANSGLMQSVRALAQPIYTK